MKKRPRPSKSSTPNPRPQFSPAAKKAFAAELVRRLEQEFPKAAPSRKESPATNGNSKQAAVPELVKFPCSPDLKARLAVAAYALDVSEEELARDAVAKMLPRWEAQRSQPALPLAENGNSANAGVGILADISLPRETLMLIALRQFYLFRLELIQKVGLTVDRGCMSDAVDLSAALLLTENLLHTAGLPTDRRAGEATDVGGFYAAMHFEEPPKNVEDREIYAAVSAQFRPWLSRSEPTAKTARKLDRICPS